VRRACLIIGCLPLLGQTSGVPPVAKSPGDTVTLEISADSQPGREPVTLKWEVVFKAQLLDLETGGPQPGSAAMESGKSIGCTARKPYILVCTLSGGEKTIANGPIAIYHFKILPTAQAGTTITFQIQKAESTTADSKKWTLNDTQAFVIIR
jgi:hypothetical protein